MLWLARLCRWELSWDVMEPIAYIISLFYSIVAYTYFLFTRDAFDLGPFREFWGKHFKVRPMAARTHALGLRGQGIPRRYVLTGAAQDGCGTGQASEDMPVVAVPASLCCIITENSRAWWLCTALAGQAHAGDQVRRGAVAVPAPPAGPLHAPPRTHAAARVKNGRVHHACTGTHWPPGSRRGRGCCAASAASCILRAQAWSLNVC